MELNPNHPVTSAVSDHWHKIAALLMFKFDELHVEISEADIQRFADSGLGAVTIDEKDKSIHLNLVTMEEGERLAKLAGGLPC